MWDMAAIFEDVELCARDGGQDGAKAAAQMISESSDATAVQAVNDVVAVGCAEVLLSHGLRIPEDISV